MYETKSNDNTTDKHINFNKKNFESDYNKVINLNKKNNDTKI